MPGHSSEEDDMRHLASPWLCLLVVTLIVLPSGSVLATAQRTFVASTGNDANSCSLAAPCRSFAIAIANTSPKGEVIVIDSAGYGAVTITRSVSIVSPPGIYGGITALSGNGVTVDGSGIVVALRGLVINGEGHPFDGILFHQGQTLSVEDCEISDVTGTGIEVDADGSTVYVKDTVLRRTGHGFSTLAAVVAVLDGVHMDSPGLTGVFAGSGSRVMVISSVISLANYGVFVSAITGQPTDVMVTRSTINECDRGIEVGAFPGAVARLVSDGNAINRVLTAAFQFEGKGGTELIYTTGTSAVGFNNNIVLGGTLTPIGVH
jgi:hypothetical protein